MAPQLMVHVGHAETTNLVPYLPFQVTVILLNQVPITNRYLTHWGRDKMADISQMTFEMHFLEWKCINFIYDFTDVSS